MDEEETESSSSSPAKSISGGIGESTTTHGLRNYICERLVRSGNKEALSNPDFRKQLDAHLSRLPKRYRVELNMDRVEDVLLHQKILAEAEDPDKRPVINVRFLKYSPAVSPSINLIPKADNDQQHSGSVGSHFKLSNSSENGRDAVSESGGNREEGVDIESCSKLEDLNLDVPNHNKEIEEEREPMEASRQQLKDSPVHEIIFSTLDKPKLLSQLSASLSDLGLDIREAHVYSTGDGFLLDVFEVQGWPDEETDGLLAALHETVSHYEGSLSSSSHSSMTEKLLKLQPKAGNWEIDKRSLKMGRIIARGSCGDLYRGTYLGQDVAVKVLKAVQLNEAIGIEFIQEVNILREVYHENVVHFIGACTKPPDFCIVTEYMTGGSLYDYLHKHHKILKLPELLKFAVDICKGMDYLHQKNIIHRDLKTANLLIDANKVIKVADFGVARFQTQEGVMTAETGTYRWMAPEVINHQPYNQKADVFSFAIVLWELATSRVPYETLTPVQAALGVRQGLRPEVPTKVHPRLSNLMQRCWDAVPAKRPAFDDILIELEELLLLVQASKETFTTENKIT